MDSMPRTSHLGLCFPNAFTTYQRIHDLQFQGIAMTRERSPTSVQASTSSTWTSHAAEVLERACAHYGGVDTWRALRTIRLIPQRLSGLLPWVKGSGRTFPNPAAFEIDPHERIARFVSYPDAQHAGIFDDGRVRIERIEDGQIVADSPAHRNTFRGLAKHRRWNALDALYFFGYALTHYHSLPFSLREARLIQTSRSEKRGALLDVLDVELPADLSTHCTRQRFYFDRDGRLTRHDYHAEVVGFWARAAHFWDRQTSVSGFPIALDRRVVARLGAQASPLIALHATFLKAEATLR
jgi:hypothetical protein